MKDYDVRSIFEQMELELIASMKRNLSRHQQWEKDEGINWTMWQAEQLKTLEEFKKNNKNIFSKKFTSVNSEIAKFVEETYKTSGFKQERAILKELAKGNTFNQTVSKGLEGAFFNLNEDKMNALIKATTSDMSKAEYAMLRMANDQYRKTIFKAQVMANSGAFTLQQSIDQATKDFLKAGINCIEYKDGRRVNIASYAEMNIRTATKRAKLISEGEVRKAYGIHTVKISRYGQCSETCLPWQGRVYVDDVYSGGTKEEAERLNLPLLSTAITGGLFHPNCKHQQTTYFYELKKSLGKLQEDGVENPNEEQEHRKNQLHIQQQKRLETGSLDPLNIEQAKERKEQWIEKDKKIKGVGEKLTINEVKEIMSDQLKLLNGDEKKILNRMTGSLSQQINFSIDYGFPLEKFMNKMILIDKALDKGLIPENIVVYRRTTIQDLFKKKNITGEELSDICGKVIKNPIYTSTSFELFDYPKRNVIIKLKVPKGTHAMYIKDISSFPKQEEILFKRNLVYIVEDFYFENKNYIMEATVLGYDKK